MTVERVDKRRDFVVKLSADEVENITLWYYSELGYRQRAEIELPRALLDLLGRFGSFSYQGKVNA